MKMRRAILTVVALAFMAVGMNGQDSRAPSSFVSPKKLGFQVQVEVLDYANGEVFAAESKALCEDWIVKAHERASVAKPSSWKSTSDAKTFACRSKSSSASGSNEAPPQTDEMYFR